MMKKFNVLVDAAGTATAISIIKGLRKQQTYDVTIFSDDMSGYNAGRYLSDGFITVPKASSPEFIDTIVSICEKEKIDVFFPIIEFGYNNLAANKKRIEDTGCKLILGPSETLKITENKYNTYQYFLSIGVPTPKSFTLQNLQDIQFPCFVKPNTFGRASIDAYKIENKVDFDYLSSKISDPIIQEFIEGEEFTADCLNSLDGRELIGCVVRKRIETKGGLAVKAEIADAKTSEVIRGYIQKILKDLPLPGVCNIQGFIQKDRILFNEINPRFAGTHAFTIEAGLNTAKHILDMINGIPSEEIKKSISINDKLKMVRYWEEIIIDGEKAYNPWKFWKE